jgi:hypothetical protein
MEPVGKKKKNGETTLADVVEAIAKLTAHVDEGFKRVDKLTERVDEGFKRVDLRFDNLIDTMGGRYRDHEGRINALESAVFKKAL